MLFSDPYRPVSSILSLHEKKQLDKKCPYSELFWFVFSPIRENTDQNNSEYGHFPRSEQVRETLHSSKFYAGQGIYLCKEQALFKFVKGFYDKMENLIQSQMNDNFNQDIFKAIDKIRNKHKQ